MLRILLALALIAPMAANADSALPFGKGMAGDQELPPPWGIGFDYFTMDQDYAIEQLSFTLQDPTLPGISLPDPTGVTVTNNIQHFDLKADVWLLPFLNVFALAGHVESDTEVDLSRATIIGLPFQLPPLTIKTDGTVLGFGGTLAYGTDSWFASLTGTYTNTDLGGDFDSEVTATTLQPRVGLIRSQWVFWLGGMYLDVEETHSGTIVLPGIGPVVFNAVLGAKDDWNAAVGAQHHFSRKSSLSFEVGFGGRTHTLFNYNYRF